MCLSAAPLNTLTFRCELLFDICVTVINSVLFISDRKLGQSGTAVSLTDVRRGAHWAIWMQQQSRKWSKGAESSFLILIGGTVQLSSLSYDVCYPHFSFQLLFSHRVLIFPSFQTVTTFFCSLPFLKKTCLSGGFLLSFWLHCVKFFFFDLYLLISSRGDMLVGFTQFEIWILD